MVSKRKIGLLHKNNNRAYLKMWWNYCKTPKHKQECNAVSQRVLSLRKKVLGY